VREAVRNCHGVFGRQRSSGARPWMRTGGASLRITLVALGLVLCSAPVLAEEKPVEKPVLKLTTPPAAVRLLGAHCRISCWLSGLFAPAVVRDNVAAVPVTNTSKSPVEIKATFVPTNGLAMAQRPGYLTLEDRPGENMMAENSPAIQLRDGDTAQLKLALKSTRLPAGLYTGQLKFEANAPNAAPITQFTAVEVRIRDSAVWALLAVLLGIVLGRLAQLVYDPKVIERVQLLDWLHELEAKVDLLQPVAQAYFKPKLADLKVQLLSRGIDSAALQLGFKALEREIDAAINAAAAPPAQASARTTPQQYSWATAASGLGHALRVLAGVTPLPLASVYDWLLPVFVLLTLVALTVVFMLQQYGGTGTAETFGAGGLADYAALFLAGVASEAIAGGLRAVKLR
jgi:hypothetical protein